MATADRCSQMRNEGGTRVAEWQEKTRYRLAGNGFGSVKPGSRRLKKIEATIKGASFFF